MLANPASKTKRTLGEGVLSLVRKNYLRGVDFDSQELVRVSVSIQERQKKTEQRRDQTAAPSQDIRGSELIVKERL
jgi:hypothetical protein